MHQTHMIRHLHMLSQYRRQCLLLALQFHNMFTSVHFFEQLHAVLSAKADCGKGSHAM